VAAEKEARTVAYTGISNPSPTITDLAPAAEDIAIARGECVAEALFHMAAIRSLQRLPKRQEAATVACPGAMLQDRMATEGKQAAHLLPGQITVDGQPVWALAAVPENGGFDHGEAERVSLRTQMCFARTNVLPALFNRADSQAERMAADTSGGLKHLFAQTVRAMWSSARVDQERPLVIDRAAVLKSLGAWFVTVNHVYTTAAQLKQLSAARASDASTRQRRQDEAQVLSVYANSFKVAANPSNFVRSHLGWIDSVYRFL
jgi:hypothetical protein